MIAKKKNKKKRKSKRKDVKAKGFSLSSLFVGGMKGTEVMLGSNEKYLSIRGPENESFERPKIF